MQVRKLREWFVEGKLCFVRANTYLSILNFLMIAMIFLSTTLWEYNPLQDIFHSKKIFLLVGFAVVIAFVVIIGYLDTKLKLWRTESEKILTPDRNPQMVPIAFQCAKMLNDLKTQNKDTAELEKNLNEIFSRFKLNKEFEFFKNESKR